jgi:hypothetical protein
MAVIERKRKYMNQPVLAWIVPVQGGGGLHPEHPIYNPPGVWPGPGRPEHPIHYPPGIWGGGNEPFPTPPIYIPGPPGQPPTIWPSPGYPEHPIVLPPTPPPSVWPTPPGNPPGGQTGSPEHPINLPPSTAGGTSPGFWALAYFQELSGWVWVWVPVPTPAAQPKKA